MLINSGLFTFAVIAITLLLVAGIIYGAKTLIYNYVKSTKISVRLFAFTIVFAICAGVFLSVRVLSLDTIVYIIDGDNRYQKKSLIGERSFTLRNGETVLLTQIEIDWNGREQRISHWLVNNSSETLCLELVRYGQPTAVERAANRLRGDVQFGNPQQLIFPYTVQTTNNIDFIFTDPPQRIRSERGLSAPRRSWLYAVPHMNMVNFISNDNTYSIDLPISLTMYAQGVDTYGDEFVNADNTILVVISRKFKGLHQDVYSFSQSIIDTYPENISFVQRGGRRTNNGFPMYSFFANISLESGETIRNRITATFIDTGHYFYKIWIESYTYSVVDLTGRIIHSFNK